MPTVPLYRPGVQARGFSGRVAVTATPDQFGGIEGTAFRELGRGLSQGGSQVAAAERRIEERRDADDARRAYTQYTERARTFLHDPDQGLYSRYGYDARDITKRGHEGLGEIASEVEQTLTSDRSMRAYRRLVDSSRSSSLDGLARHEASQLRTAELESLRSSTSASVQNAVANYTDEPAVQAEIARGEAAIRSVAMAQGHGDDWLQNEVQKFRSNVHDGVLQRMLIDDPAAAKAYLEEHGDELNPSRLPVLEKAVRESSTRQKAQDAVDKAFVELGVDPTSEELTPAQHRDLLEEARAISDPEVRDAAVRRVEARIAQYDRVWRRAQGERLDAAWATILQGGEVEDVDPTLWAQLDGAKQRAIQDYTARRVKGQSTETDWDLADRLNRLYIEDRDAFANHNLSQYFGRLDEPERRHFMALQRAANDKSVKAAEKAERERVSRTQAMWELDQQLLALRINPRPAKKEKSKAERVAKIRTQVWNALVEFQDQEGRLATPEERAMIIASLLTPGRLETDWRRDPEAVYAETLAPPQPGEEERRFYVADYDDIPQDARDRIEAELDKRSLPKTQERVEDLYTKWQVRKRREGRTGRTTSSEEAVPLGVRN